MLNRRLLRVKVLQAVYAYHQSEVKEKRSALSYLRKSILGIENTYTGVLQFVAELFNQVKTKMNPNDKYLKATDISLRNYHIMTNNMCLDLLLEHTDTASLFTRPSYNWSADDDFLKLIFRKVIETAWFEKFVNDEVQSFSKDQNFLLEIVKYLVEECEDFNLKMEELNIHWQDEKIPVLKSVERLIKSATENSKSIELPIISKDLDDDLEFVEKLFQFTTDQHEYFEGVISSHTPGWDPERIARMDLYIMTMALVEFVHFPGIPVKVSMNEYLELAKIYSTPQSSKFINGILDTLLNQMKKSGEIRKVGRGLVE
jgi:N utilization substance protein B